MPNTSKLVEIDHVRENLIELLNDTRANAAWHHWSCEESADHLIANGVAVQEWIWVKDRLPDETKDEYVLVVCDYYGKIKVETRKMWHIDCVVTHWMPLPEPPKGE